jgi:hypothetical protein
MIVKDSTGREVYITVYGRYIDDIEIDEAYYMDDESDVPNDEIDFILDNYASEIEEAWMDRQCSMAEDLMDRMKEGDY